MCCSSPTHYSTITTSLSPTEWDIFYSPFMNPGFIISGKKKVGEAAPDSSSDTIFFQRGVCVDSHHQLSESSLTLHAIFTHDGRSFLSVPPQFLRLNFQPLASRLDFCTKSFRIKGITRRGANFGIVSTPKLIESQHRQLSQIFSNH